MWKFEKRGKHNEIADAMTARSGHPLLTTVLWGLTLLTAVCWFASENNWFWQLSVMLLLVINALRDDWL